eukprot:9260852-Lingulodinium_polyedra.AAC.1
MQQGARCTLWRNADTSQAMPSQCTCETAPVTRSPRTQRIRAKRRSGRQRVTAPREPEAKRQSKQHNRATMQA